ncbi:MAG: GNAT family acetyltransferase [Methylacidiphilales bacterium]|nr:GNAT family acetyltransferase [Candidatus Methylacidiphilales bacterium]MDW8349866.1 GNAT family acetyltransferase [Verrucomicrobiae bacterium]
MPSTRPSSLHIRFYRPEDRPHIRKLCADTGFLGNPIDPVFQDRELFADFLTAYYTDWEPESALVCEVDGIVKGYLIGCRHPFRQRIHNLIHLPIYLIKILSRLFTYNSATRRYLRWLLFKGRKETPYTPPATPHFHINLLPEARNVANTRALIDAFLHYLKQNGEKSVYGQIVTFDHRRTPRMFERYGFHVIDKREITKYRYLHPQPVYLYTVIKDLTLHSTLYGHNLARPHEKSKPSS